VEFLSGFEKTKGGELKNKGSKDEGMKSRVIYKGFN